MHDNINLQDTVQEGFVMSVDGDLAKVRVAPNADCDNCGQCNIVHMEILAYNPLNATIGQKIRFTMIHDSMIKISFMMFILPLISILGGIYAGSVFALSAGINGTAASTAGAFMFLAVAILIIYLYDKKYKLNRSNFPQIIEVIK